MASRGNREPDGIYANHFTVGQSGLEFVIDFSQSYSGKEDGAIHTRIVTAPWYARALWELLGKSIEQHERANGAIRPPGKE